MTDRIATFTQTNQIISNNLRLQIRYGESQLQVSSGFKSNDYAGIARDASRLLSLQTDYDRIVQQTENTQIALDRVNVMYSTITNMSAQTDQFMADLQTSVSGAGFGLTGPDLQNNAQTRLNQFVGGLNTQIADRFLFAGSNTQVAPVDLNDPAWGGQTFTLPGPSVADTDYYQGNDYIQTVEAIDGFNVNYGVLASNSAFEKIIRGYDLIITNPSDPDTLDEAFRIMKEGQNELQILNASISQDAQTLDTQIDDNQEEMNLIDTQIVSIREVDVAEASVTLAQLQTQLEASYTVTSAMLDLKLSDYFR